MHAMRRSRSVLPAYAGMIPVKGADDVYDMGAPRVCGDDPEMTVGEFTFVTCSPRMRG